MRRRLDVAPSATLPGRTYLVFTGTQGGGMILVTSSRERDCGFAPLGDDGV